MPSTFFDDCCLRKRNIFSVAHSCRQPPSTVVYCTPSTVVTVYILCCMASSSNTWTYLCANQTVHEAVVRMCSRKTLSAQKMHSTFARHVPSSREVLIENTLNCPCLNMSSRVTPEIRCAASLSSHRIWKPPVVTCSMHQRVVIGCLS